ncbi:Rv3235 family protein [uncultured Thermomonospora sp.]|uniref:Rv3235 family protein n=1 Tax=uncultured Thermomonospora sp. TaxID=671175 RepID=UPI00259B7741|nr:Rv3235 family protein [uncultured Thermomonospora sp.]
MPSRTRRHTSSPVRVLPYAAASAQPAVFGALALQPEPAPAGLCPLPGGPSRPGERAAAGRSRPAISRNSPAMPVLRAVGSPDRDEDLPAVAAATVRLVAEVLAGIRPVRQLARRATPQVCEGLLPFLAPHRGPVRPPRMLASWLQEPAPGAAETGAVIALAGRVQALALRLERHRGRWRCTALETTAPPGTPPRQRPPGR